MLKVFFIIIVLLVISCTSTAIKPPQINTDYILPYGLDLVWEASLLAITETNFTIASANKQSCLLTTDWFIINDPLAVHGGIKDYAVTPNIWLATWTKLKMKLTLIESSLNKDSTKVRVKSSISAFESNLSNEWHVCYSKGKIESLFVDKLNKQLENK